MDTHQLFHLAIIDTQIERDVKLAILQRRSQKEKDEDFNKIRRIREFLFRHSNVKFDLKIFDKLTYVQFRL